VPGETAAELAELILELRSEVTKLAAVNAELIVVNARLLALLDESRRGGKRQAAPFSKGEPVVEPKRPGRKHGLGYGKRASRPIPDRVDRTLDAALPTGCPHCGGNIVADKIHDQFVCEVPHAVPQITRFRVHVGHCQSCRRRVQGHHCEQHSDALGAAGVQLGPRATGIGHLLHYRYGLSFARCAAVLSEMFGLPVSRAVICRAAASTAVELAPTQAAIETALNTASMVVADETGWRVAGRKAWLWVVTSPNATAYRITKGRGYDDITPLLHGDYHGVLVRDGWAPYRKYANATHQSCCAHLARRCHELREELPTCQHGFPNQISELLNQAFAWRDSERPAEQRTNAAADLQDRLQLVCNGPIIGERNQVFARHLLREAPTIFTFLTNDTDAANWRAEQAVRPAVVNRKTFGGNRTQAGALTQQTMMSFLVTARQQGHHALDTLVRLARAPTPAPAFTIT
jgi:transposase